MNARVFYINEGTTELLSAHRSTSALQTASQVWRLPDPKCIETRRGVAGAGFCRFVIVERPRGSESSQLVAGSMGGSGVTAWDLGSWQEITNLEHQGQEFYSVCVPEGTSLVLGAAGDSKVGDAN